MGDLPDMSDFAECLGFPSNPVARAAITFFLHRISVIEQADEKPRQTVMVVDNTDLIRSMAQIFLKRAGYKVITAESGEECLNLYAEEASQPDLIVLDCDMPGMGGKQSLELLKARNPALKIIFSCGAMPQDEGVESELLAKGVAS